MNSRFRLIAVLLAVLALFAASCGSDSEGDTTTDEETTTTAAEAEPEEEEEPAEPEEEPAEEEAPEEEGEEEEAIVRADADLVIWADDTRTPVITPFAEAFADENGLTVAVQEVPFDRHS